MPGILEEVANNKSALRSVALRRVVLRSCNTRGTKLGLERGFCAVNPARIPVTLRLNKRRPLRTSSFWKTCSLRDVPRRDLLYDKGMRSIHHDRLKVTVEKFDIGESISLGVPSGPCAARRCFETTQS